MSRGNDSTIPWVPDGVEPTGELPAVLESRLGDYVAEQILARSGLSPRPGTVGGTRPAIAVHLDIHVDEEARYESIGTLLADVQWVTAAAVRHFSDHGFLSVVKEDDSLLFISPLPMQPFDGVEDHEATEFARSLDDQLARSRIVDAASNFKRRLKQRFRRDRRLVVELRLEEGSLAEDVSYAERGALLAPTVWSSLELDSAA